MAKYPIHRYSASTREHSNPDDRLVKTLISSNTETQRSVARVMDSLNELVKMLKEGDDTKSELPPAPKDMPISQPLYSNGSASPEAHKQILQRLNNLEGQNRQIVEALNVIISHLKRIVK